MALTDTVVRQAKPTGKPAGDKYADGGGMYLLVKGTSKYWRMDRAHTGAGLSCQHSCYCALASCARESGRQSTSTRPNGTYLGHG